MACEMTAARHPNAGFKIWMFLTLVLWNWGRTTDVIHQFLQCRSVLEEESQYPASRHMFM